MGLPSSNPFCRNLKAVLWTGEMGDKLNSLPLMSFNLLEPSPIKKLRNNSYIYKKVIQKQVNDYISVSFSHTLSKHCKHFSVIYVCFYHHILTSLTWFWLGNFANICKGGYFILWHLQLISKTLTEFFFKGFNKTQKSCTCDIGKPSIPIERHRTQGSRPVWQYSVGMWGIWDWDNRELRLSMIKNMDLPVGDQILPHLKLHL